MAQIVGLERIKKVLDPLEVIRVLEEGFAAYSLGKVIVPPVGQLCFDDPPGDCHIKYGYMAGGKTFVVKIATGFYRNPDIGLPSSNGLMLVFNRMTGEAEAVLLDEGWLTDVRTAAAGAIAAKYLARRKPKAIGIIGSGTQARMQLDYLRYVIDCREAMVWGRSRARAERYREEMAALGFRVTVATEISAVCDSCDLIVSTTPSREPLINAGQVSAGAHITAVGADGGGKQEVDAAVFSKADIRVVDSLAQCREYGDSAYALRAGLISEDSLIELGRVIRNPRLGRIGDEQITVADLTGVAVQDIQIAELVLNSL